MIPLSGWVLLAGAVLASPALWSTLVAGTMPLDVALTRYLVATGGCWVVVSLVADLVWPTPAGGPDDQGAVASTTEATEPAADH